jgi:non-heme chloroperoxidase
MFFEVSDGTRLAYEDYGTGEPVVFLSSAMLSATMWEHQVPFLTDRGHRCVLLDRRGHGRSDRPSTGYDLDTAADDLAELLARLDLTGVTLVGHSAGGAEAVRYLARHGDTRVARLALVSAVLPCLRWSEDNPDGLPPEVLDAQLAEVRADRPRWLARQSQAFFATHLGNGVSPEQVADTYRQCLGASLWATLRVQEAIFHADSRPALRSLRVPTLVVHGAADFSAPVELTGRRTAELVPQCTYREYPTGGHGIHLSHAAELNRDLLEFVGG